MTTDLPHFLPCARRFTSKQYRPKPFVGLAEIHISTKPVLDGECRAEDFVFMVQPKVAEERS